jgi:hypothetical protein
MKILIILISMMRAAITQKERKQDKLAINSKQGAFLSLVK